MDTSVSALEKTVSSKEHKALVKCAMKNCKDYEKILREEEGLIKEVVALQTSIRKLRDISEILRQSKDIIDKSIKLLELNQNKKAVMCVIKECGSEYVDMTAANSKYISDIYREQMKKLDVSIQRITKKQSAKK